MIIAQQFQVGFNLMEEEALKQQIAYYRARAAEYDEWFYRQGRYDRGPEINAAWFGEMDQVRKALEEFKPVGDVLELAGGTGIWTQELTKTARTLTVVDSSPEVIEINRSKLGGAEVHYVQADLFQWKPERQYDVVFFAFWHSHVPPDRLEPFWETVKSSLVKGGRVFMVDSLFERSSTAKDHVLVDRSDVVITRKLNDGQEYQIYKVFYGAAELNERLGSLGWAPQLKETAHYNLYGAIDLKNQSGL